MQELHLLQRFARGSRAWPGRGAAVLLAAIPVPLHLIAGAWRRPRRSRRPRPSRSSAPRCCRAISRPGACIQNADPVVQAVLIGLVLAFVVTWTVWLAKTIELMAAARRVRRAA